ncbi:hypothetical protein ACJJTC_018757 [Scirpophaga incertulas]
MQIAADLHLDHREVIKEHRDFEVSRVKEACGNMRVIQVIQHRPMMNTKTEEKSEKKKELYRHVEVEQEAEEPMYTSEDNESKEKDDDDKCEEIIREKQDDENIQGIEEYRTNVATDASNHGAIKMFPLMVRFYSSTTNLKTCVLDFYEDASETASAIHMNLVTRLKECKIDSKHLTILCR